MKTLLVGYTPRQERSRSKALLDAFRCRIRNSEVEQLDLCRSVPDLFDAERVDAYFARNIARRPLSPAEERCLAGMLQMTAQLKSADIVAVAFPMFNFSMPAIVKAWFDCVLHVGETVDPSGGKYRGMMDGKKALVLVAAGGIYSSGNGHGPCFGPNWEHAASLAELEFRFMGYSEVRAVLAEGMATSDRTAAEENLQAAIAKVQSIADAWFTS